MLLHFLFCRLSLRRKITPFHWNNQQMCKQSVIPLQFQELHDCTAPQQGCEWEEDVLLPPPVHSHPHPEGALDSCMNHSMNLNELFDTMCFFINGSLSWVVVCIKQLHPTPKKKKKNGWDVLLQAGLKLLGDLLDSPPPTVTSTSRPGPDRERWPVHDGDLHPKHGPGEVHVRGRHPRAVHPRGPGRRVEGDLGEAGPHLLALDSALSAARPWNDRDPEQAKGTGLQMVRWLNEREMKCIMIIMMIMNEFAVLEDALGKTPRVMYFFAWN